MKSSAKQIQSSVSPNLRVRLSPSLTLKTFLRRLRWSKVKKCYTTAIYTHTGGLIRFYLVIWSVLSQFKWPLLFLHHRGRGRGTRLSIRSQDPNNSSDTERGPCLVSLRYHLDRAKRFISFNGMKGPGEHIFSSLRASLITDNQLHALLWYKFKMCTDTKSTSPPPSQSL